MNIRIATPEDCRQLLQIYTPYVLDTSISFETHPPLLHDFQNKLRSGIKNHPWIVVEYNNTIIAYAYASPHKSRSAYNWSVECSVYVDLLHQRSGVASSLYKKLFYYLAKQNIVNIFAVITLPNDKSVRFHKKFGFEKIGVCKQAGFKLGKWHDVSWWQLQLQKCESPQDFIPFEMLE